MAPYRAERGHTVNVDINVVTNTSDCVPRKMGGDIVLDAEEL